MKLNIHYSIVNVSYSYEKACFNGSVKAGQVWFNLSIDLLMVSKNLLLFRSCHFDHFLPLGCDLHLLLLQDRTKVINFLTFQLYLIIISIYLVEKVMPLSLSYCLHFKLKLCPCYLLTDSFEITYSNNILQQCNIEYKLEATYKIPNNLQLKILIISYLYFMFKNILF